MNANASCFSFSVADIVSLRSLLVATDHPGASPCQSHSSTRLSLSLWLLIAAVCGCATTGEHYVRVEQSLLRGDFERADHVVQAAESTYGAKSRLLYEMDRGMTLHLAGKYDSSNALLEQADQNVEAAYTRRIRTESKAFLVNDTELFYEGDPYEQVMINVIKGLNYAASGRWQDAAVEARRIAHRLNLLADLADGKEGYRDDGFARYVSGVLFEATGEINDAFIAYRNAYDAYREARSWSKMSVPPSLPADLLRTSDALHFTEEHREYRRTFPDVDWKPMSDTKHLAQIVLVSYNGRAPYKEDMFIDLPVSLQALNLVLLSKRMNRPGQITQARAADSALYALNGSIVRVALPRLVPQKTQTAFSEITVSGDRGAFTVRTERVNNLTAVAEKTLADRFTSITLKAVARAAVKNALAAGAGIGTRAAMGRNNDAGPWVALLVSAIGKLWAIYSEKADTRSWRTLPDEIQMARVWVPPGTYKVGVRPMGRAGGELHGRGARTVTVRAGETMLLTDRVLP